MTLRRVLPALLALMLLGAAALAYATTRQSGSEGVQLGANGCPPGYTSREERMKLERRERASERTRPFRGESPGEESLSGDVGAGGEQQEIAEGPACVNRKQPEPVGELTAIKENDAVRYTGGVTDRVKAGALRAATAEKREIAARGATLPGSGGDWNPAGTGPLISDDPRFGEVNGLGLADLAGRISDFSRDPVTGRVFAAVGEGGVWQSDDNGSTWRSIGDPLPTQAIGGIGYVAPKGDRGEAVVVSSGDSVFGGGGTFAGLGMYRTTDGGKTWQRSSGVPDNIITFRVAVDPSNSDIVYAATGAGLFRSDDAGVSFANVALPTGEGVAAGQPDCTGAPYGKEGCFLANMVTDVEVQTPGGSTNVKPSEKGGKVIAAVGWRAGDKQNKSANFASYEESPNNGLYGSDTGEAGSFKRINPGGVFTRQTAIGRIEFGSATGEKQNHEVIYAIVEDSDRFNGELGPGAITVLDGIYASTDFGKNWRQLASAVELQSPTTGSALNITFQAVGQFGPGIQSWYNQWIEPDPTRQDGRGIPTRLLFGLEEVWQNDVTPVGVDQDATFKVVGRYFSGTTCLALDSPTGTTCVADRERRDQEGLTTHPDHHAALFVPTKDGVRLLVGHDGGVNVQDRTAAQTDFSNNAWGRGANQGFNTLLPYDAQVAKDNTIYAGLQDNGELKIQPDGKQFMTFGGDGAFSAVDPDDSKITYEGLPGGTINKSTNGGESYDDVTPENGDTFMFINPFTMDPLSSKHLITAGNIVTETNDAAGEWTDVFTLGDAPSGAAYAMSAIDTRSIPSGGAPGGGPAKATANVPEYEGGAGTVPDPVNPTVGTGADAPRSTSDQPFTIKPDETNASATIRIMWGNARDDWDLTVLRKGEDGRFTEIASSAQGDTTEEQVVLTQPAAGDYIVRVKNFAATGTFKGRVDFVAGQGNQVGDAAASYVAFCGFCDSLNDETRPFDNGVATNVTPDGKVGKKGAEDNWRRAAAKGLPKRYITSIQADPVDPKTVYATIAGYSRRWLPVGVLGENPDVGKGNVFKSTDAGETFTNISGNMPDVPANWTTVRNGQLVVATNAGVYVSQGTDGGTYELLGSGLPNAPVFTLELKPKASPSEPDTLIAATQGRGVYRYEFKDPAKAAPAGPRPGATPPAGGGGGGGGGGVTACASSAGFRSVSAGRARRGARLSFSRRVQAPVTVDVFRVSQGRRVVKERLVARFVNKSKSFTWNGRSNRGSAKKRKVGTGYYFVRYTMLRGGKRFDVRRVTLRKSSGRFSRRPDYYRRDTCDLLGKFKLERPVFGGPKRVSLKAAYRLNDDARVQITITRGSKVIRRYKAIQRAGKRTYRITLPASKRPKGDYRVRLRATGSRQRVNTVLTSRRL